MLRWLLRQWRLRRRVEIRVGDRVELVSVWRAGRLTEARLADVLVRALAPVTFHNAHCRRERACRQEVLTFVLTGTGATHDPR